MNMSLFQIIVAIFMVSATLAMLVTFRKYKRAAVAKPGSIAFAM